MNETQARYRASTKGRATLAAWRERNPYTRTPERVRVQETYRRERRKFLDDLKVFLGCADCGYREYAESLQFDHLPEFEKSFCVAEKWDGRLEILLAELDKCEVVCANCHHHRTAVRRGPPKWSIG